MFFTLDSHFRIGNKNDINVVLPFTLVNGLHGIICYLQRFRLSRPVMRALCCLFKRCIAPKYK
jgi:hypothetical protein